METAIFKWEIIPLDTPKIIKCCPHCNNNVFKCSDKFRVNSNKKLSDVWLIYLCSNCDYTLNLTLITRQNVNNLDKDRFNKFQINDKELAWEYAFNRNLLGQSHLRVDYDFPITVHHELDKLRACQEDKVRINFYSKYNLDVPIKKVLKTIFPFSNSTLETLVNNNALIIEHTAKKKLNAKIGSEIYITIDNVKFKNFLTVSSVG